MESESLRDRLVRSKASRTGLLSPVFPAPLFRCDLNQTRIYLRTRPSSRRLPLHSQRDARVQSDRTSAEPPRAAVKCEDSDPSLHRAYRLRRLASRRGSSCKSPFEGLYDWWTSEGGAGGGGLFEMPPPAKGTSKGPPNPTVSIWEGRSGAHRPRSGGMQGRNTSSQTLARVEPPKQNRRRPRLRPPAKGTTSAAPRPG
jgi:hypothetical protein